MNPKPFTLNRIVGLGIYINPDPYRFVALQLGPWWIYLYHQAWFKRGDRS